MRKNKMFDTKRGNEVGDGSAVRESPRVSEKERQADRQTETDRQTDRQTDIDI